MLKKLVQSSVIVGCRMSTAVSNINNITLHPDTRDLYFEFSQNLNQNEELKVKTKECMSIYPNFIDQAEEDSLMKELEPYMSRLHYETSHWDDAIHNYRETERSRWTKANETIINRVRAVAFPPGVPQMKMVHVLDLAKKGVIKPHIDSTRFCGNTIAGLSLLSTSIMRLVHEDDKALYCDVLLPKSSLYVMKDIVRFKFTHEILAEEESKMFKGQVIARDRRISIMCRNEPERDPNETNLVMDKLMEKLSKSTE